MSRSITARADTADTTASLASADARGKRAGADARARIIVVDDDAMTRRLVRAWLEHASHLYDVETFDSGEACLAALATMTPDAICLDVSMPGLSGLQTLERIRASHSQTPVIMLTADTTVDTVVSAMNMGAYDYLTKPIGQTRLLKTLRNAVDHARAVARLEQLERQARAHGGYPGIIGSAEPMQRLFHEMERVSAADITALIHGESGTGKELVARAIHEASGRASGPFVALNCAAIPETLQESELFGYEKGAFTGAGSRRVGRFELAHGGTLFLDEVGELSLGLQAKLLRVLQERVFHRVGGNQEVQSDFRLLTATHRSLRELVDAGRFREDFYFRVAVFELEVPPLRERRDDIPALAQHFINRFAESVNKRARLSPPALDALLAYDWPGNVRELQNAVHRALVATGDDVIRPRDLPARVLTPSPPASPHAAASPLAPAQPASAVAAATQPVAARVDSTLPAVPVVGEDGAPLCMEAIEREAILLAIERTGGNLSQVVRELGIGRTTLYRRLKQYEGG